MRNRIKTWSFLFLTSCLLLLVSSFSYAASIQAQIDRNTLRLDETLRLTITIKGGSALTTPEIPPKGNFEVVGRQAGNAIEILNGQMSVTNTFQYLLKPVKQGRFTIGPIKAHIDGKTYSTSPISVTVLKGQQKPNYLPPPQRVPRMPSFPPGFSPPPGWQRPPPTPSPPATGQKRDYTFLTAQTDKKEAYMGEPILYTFRLYSAVSLQNAQLKLPEFKSFISEELIKERQYETELDGRRYAVNEWRFVLYPVKAGKVKTGVAKVEASVPQSIFRSPYDPFFRRPTQRYEQKTFHSPNLTLTIKKRPPAPANFTGLVGEFSISSHLDQDRLQTGDTMNLKITVSGKGNIREGILPKLPETPFFKIYPGTPKLDVHKSLNGLEGKKTFPYALVAERPGKTTVGPMDATYFNPKTKSYEKLVVPAREISIQGSVNKEKLVTAGLKEDQNLLSAPTQVSLSALKSPEAVLHRQVPKDYTLGLAYLFLAIPPLGYLMLILWRRQQARRFAQADDRKRSRAFRKAKAALGALNLSSNKEQENLEEISPILREYLGDSLLLKGGALTPREVEELLKQKKVPADSVRRMVYILEQLDSWKYGGMREDFPSGKALQQEIVGLLREIEKVL